MKNRFNIDQSVSQLSKKSLTLNTKKSATLHDYDETVYKQNDQSSNKLNEFFQNFHQTFIVLQAPQKSGLEKNRKKPSLSELVTQKQNKKPKLNQQSLLNVTSKRIKTSSNIAKTCNNITKTCQNIMKKCQNLIKNPQKSIHINQTTNMNPKLVKVKTYCSDKNLQKMNKLNNNTIKQKQDKKPKQSTKKKNISCSKSNKNSSKNSVMKSKKTTSKKTKLANGSILTGLGSSAINIKDDVHIANYLRLKIHAR